MLLVSRTAGGNMIYIEHCTDFEFYSGNSKGAIQGYGYVFASGKSTFLATSQAQRIRINEFRDWR
jgi:hypothetical protein